MQGLDNIHKKKNCTINDGCDESNVFPLEEVELFDRSIILSIRHLINFGWRDCTRKISLRNVSD